MRADADRRNILLAGATLGIACDGGDHGGVMDAASGPGGDGYDRSEVMNFVLARRQA